jgi:type I restriction enzyme R subunit
MEPEQKARKNIDLLLEEAGWKVQAYQELSLGVSLGVAVCNFPLKSGAADYLLFVDRKAVGAVEAKPEGTTLSGVSEQTKKYLAGVPDDLPCVQVPLPFAYESTGSETLFADLRDPDFRSRHVFAFHRPETLRDWAAQTVTLRGKLRGMPPLVEEGLRACQVEAIESLEKSFAEAKPRSLIQMASGSGKTYTAVSFVYRLIKLANARRVLFLVDRSNLGRQTRKEFQQYVTPDDGRKFTELYNVQHLTTNTIDPVSRVCITTIQRLYSMLKGEELDPELEEPSLFEISPIEEKPKEVPYNSSIPIETFDFIITDECTVQSTTSGGRCWSTLMHSSSGLLQHLLNRLLASSTRTLSRNTVTKERLRMELMLGMRSTGSRQISPREAAEWRPATMWISGTG